MNTPRVIPCLQLIDGSLVKAFRFGRYTYVGDPSNTVRIFNELEVDELCFLDIRASLDRREPDLGLLREIASEAFMPMAYGGGIRRATAAMEILAIGFEKIVVNTAAVERPALVAELARLAGSQAVVGAIDVRTGRLGRRRVHIRDGRVSTDLDPVAWARRLEQLGCGELLVTSMEREGTWAGFDVGLMRQIASAVTIPVIAHGGCGRVEHIAAVVRQAGVSAAAVGSMVVFHKKGQGVLVGFPERRELERALGGGAVPSPRLDTPEAAV
jgi:imidazole glycerol-phosphate synthase subunit HisF